LKKALANGAEAAYLYTCAWRTAVRLLVKRDAQGASLNEATMETSVGRLESLGQVGFEGD
jgi:hypothetical protein